MQYKRDIKEFTAFIGGQYSRRCNNINVSLNLSSTQVSCTVFFICPVELLWPVIGINNKLIKRKKKKRKEQCRKSETLAYNEVMPELMIH